MQTSFVLIKTCMYVPPGFRKWPFNTHNKNNFLNCDFYYMHKAADTGEGKRKDNYRFTPEIHTGYFLPDCSSHLKSLVANWIPSTAESKWSFCNKRKKGFCWNTTIAQTLIVANLTFGLKSSSIWDLQSLFLFHTQLLAPFGITEKEQREKQKIENAGGKRSKMKGKWKKGRKSGCQK